MVDITRVPVSVVMCAYNCGRFLREAVESILDQSFPEHEFIIIDDGSSDGSASMLDSYQMRDSRIRIYHQENQGLVESLNRGCRLAKGKYIAIMHADDVAVRDRLMWQVAFMEKHPEVGLLGGAVEWIDANGKSLGVHRSPAKDSEIKAALLYSNVLWHPAVVLRKECLDYVGGYRKLVPSEDYDMWLRIAESFEVANLDRVVLKYRIHLEQASVRRRREQILTALASRAAALSRRNGNADPLDLMGEITTVALAGLLKDVAPPAVLGSDSKAKSPRNTSRDAQLRWICDLSEVVADDHVLDHSGSTPNSPVDSFLSVDCFEDSLRHGLEDECERNFILARFFAAMGDKFALHDDSVPAKQFYRRALRKNPKMLKVYFKLLLLSFGKTGSYMRSLSRSLRRGNALIQLSDGMKK